MLKIRHFEKGVDEQVWVTVLNAAFKNFKDWRTISVEEFVSEEESSNSDFEGRMIAELDGKPVGVIHAHADESGQEKKGFLQDFGVIPEFRGLGVEEKLVESAIDELEKHGITVVQAPRIRWPHQRKEDRIQFLENMGFELIRKISLMEIDLADISSNIGEKRARARAMAKVILDVDDLNQTRAKRLYEKVGFEVVEQYLTYEKRLEP